MVRTRHTFWCVKGCGKRVDGKNQIGGRHKFICSECNTVFTVDELETCNNMNRVRHQRLLARNPVNPSCSEELASW